MSKEKAIERKQISITIKNIGLNSSKNRYWTEALLGLKIIVNLDQWLSNLGKYKPSFGIAS